MTVTMAGYSGDAVDAMAGSGPVFVAHGRMFSTADRDNDASPSNCAVTSGAGGWWFGWWIGWIGGGLWFGWWSGRGPRLGECDERKVWPSRGLLRKVG